ncbi:MAG TPA: methylmalonyl-CoA epimerase [bacterium]|nr:methylmalonyl-CoA epimerase [bacterium]
MSGLDPRGIEHVGLAVADLEEAKRIFTELLGFRVLEEETVADQMARVVKLDAGGSELELLGSTDSQGPIGKYLAKRGPGIHHVTIRVPHLATTLRALEERGVELIDRTPRVGAGGKLIAFLHPKSTAGILIELCEDSPVYPEEHA